MTHLADPSLRRVLETVQLNTDTINHLVKAMVANLGTPPTGHLAILSSDRPVQVEPSVADMTVLDAPASQKSTQKPAAALPNLTVAESPHPCVALQATPPRESLFSSALLQRIAGSKGVPSEGDLRLLAAAILGSEGEPMTTPTIADIMARELGFDGAQLMAVKSKLSKVVHRASKPHGVLTKAQTPLKKMGWMLTPEGQAWLDKVEPSPWA